MAKAKVQTAPAAAFVSVTIAASDLATTVLPNPRNSRSNWDEPDLEEWKAFCQSLATCQLQPCLARRTLSPQSSALYELIDGGRRYKAARQMQIPLRLDVVPDGLSDAQAIEYMGRANEERSGFDPISRGQWYKALLEAEPKLTQKALATRLGAPHSQAAIAQHLGLLALPLSWRKLLIARVITETHCRALQPLVKQLTAGPDDEEYPQGTPAGAATLLEALATELSDELEEDRPAATQMSHWIETTLRATEFVDVAPKAYSRLNGEYVQVRWTLPQLHALRDELGLVHVPGEYNNKLIATHPQRAAELHGNLIAELTARAEKKLPGGKKKTGQPALSLRDQNRLDAQNRAKQENQLQRRYEVHLATWAQRICGERIRAADDAALLSTLFLFTVTPGRRDWIHRTIGDVAAQTKLKLHGRTEAGELLTAVRDLKPFLLDCLSQWLQADLFAHFDPLFSFDDLGYLVRAFAVDLRTWRPDLEFLRLHNTEQLQSLRAEWKAKPAVGVKLADKLAETHEMLRLRTGSGLEFFKTPKRLVEIWKSWGGK